jgi:hypothetical protein
MNYQSLRNKFTSFKSYGWTIMPHPKKFFQVIPLNHWASLKDWSWFFQNLQWWTINFSWNNIFQKFLMNYLDPLKDQPLHFPLELWSWYERSSFELSQWTIDSIWKSIFLTLSMSYWVDPKDNLSNSPNELLAQSKRPIKTHRKGPSMLVEGIKLNLTQRTSSSFKWILRVTHRKKEIGSQTHFKIMF